MWRWPSVLPVAGCFFLAVGGCEKVPRETTSHVVASPNNVPSAGGTGGAGPSLNASSVAVLKAALADKDYATRLIAVEALGHARTDVVVPWLEHALGDPEHDVRMAAVEALISLRTARALGVVVSVRDDTSEDLDIRALAAAALL